MIDYLKSQGALENQKITTDFEIKTIKLSEDSYRQFYAASQNNVDALIILKQIGLLKVEATDG